jgi:hypothetical protein
MFSDRHGADPAERGSEATPGRLTASWREATGAMSEIVPEEARLSDLVVLARDVDGDRTTRPTIEAVIFNSGRPLLLAPSEQASAIGTAPAIARIPASGTAVRWQHGPSGRRCHSSSGSARP